MPGLRHHDLSAVLHGRGALRMPRGGPRVPSVTLRESPRDLHHERTPLYLAIAFVVALVLVLVAVLVASRQAPTYPAQAPYEGE